MIALILACEIAFWVVIVAGLSLRYVLEQRRAGLFMLAMAPVVDIVLLTAVAFDLRSGATATFAHTLAAFYLGFSIAYGHRMVQWADTRFAHRFAGGPPPVKLFGAGYTRQCWVDLARTVLAVGIASAIAWALIWFTGDADRTRELRQAYSWSAVIIGLEAIWAVSYTIWPRKPAKPTTGSE